MARSIVNVKILNQDEAEINPATEAKQDAMPNAFNEEALWLLRRLVKLMESSAVVDINNRQRVSVENVISTSLGRSIPGLDSGAVPVPNQPGIASAPTPASGTTYWQPVWSGPVDPRFTNMEQARINYNTGIRSNLLFS